MLTNVIKVKMKNKILTKNMKLNKHKIYLAIHEPQSCPILDSWSLQWLSIFNGTFSTAVGCCDKSGDAFWFNWLLFLIVVICSNSLISDERKFVFKSTLACDCFLFNFFSGTYNDSTFVTTSLELGGDSFNSYKKKNVNFNTSYHFKIEVKRSESHPWHD